MVIENSLKIYLVFIRVIVIWSIVICTLCASASEPKIYPLVREQLIYFKEDNMKIYYGGPVEFSERGITWLLPVVFSDQNNNVTATYEVSFINCRPDNADGANLYFIKTSDVNIKFQNTLNKEYDLFSSLINGNYNTNKYILIRYADVSMVTYPDTFIDFNFSNYMTNDLNKIAEFLARKYRTQSNINYINSNNEIPQINTYDDNYIMYNPEKVMININNKEYIFYVLRIISKKDIWKAYYIISRKKIDKNAVKDQSLIRIDSGCVSGQIYDDASCDCLDQLQSAIHAIIMDGNDNDIIIHVPTHDGRGFGTAPKAETEIYKRGGKGMINTTEPIDTIKAAKLLYKVDDQSYDIRSYDGVGAILKLFKYKEVVLLTDNKLKVESIQKYGINVTRRKTDTDKQQCKNHLLAKRSEVQYYAE